MNEVTHYYAGWPGKALCAGESLPPLSPITSIQADDVTCPGCKEVLRKHASSGTSKTKLTHSEWLAICARDAKPCNPQIHDGTSIEEIGDPFKGAVQAYRDRRKLKEAVEELASALHELVACKDLKDRIINLDYDSTQELDSKAKEYCRRKPKAWESAREALAPFEERK